MALLRSPITMVAGQFSDCPGCGRDLTGIYRGATYCPECGAHLDSRRGSRVRAVAIGWAGALASRFRRSRATDPASGSGQRTPIIIGYGNALFRLGWRYERTGSASRNVAEALRCYRKSARLGNLDAMVRLALGENATEPKRVIPLES
jgi:hypothetical protein